MFTNIIMVLIIILILTCILKRFIDIFLSFCRFKIEVLDHNIKNTEEDIISVINKNTDIDTILRDISNNTFSRN